MNKFKLNGTDLEITPLCLGMMSYGSPAWQKWVLDESSSHKLIAQAIDFGINFFDTADLYSDGRSEIILGELLKERKTRHSCVVATKVGYPTTQVPGSGFSKSRMKEALAASLKRLKTDYIDLYQLHAWDPITPPEDALGVLEDFKREGKIRHYGVCNFTFSQLKSSLKVNNNLASFQGQYNLAYRGIEAKMVPFLLEKELPLLAYSPLARGYLGSPSSSIELDNSNAERLQHDMKGRGLYGDNQLDALLTRIRKLATGYGVGSSTIAISWVLSKPAVAAVIFGASGTEQLIDAIRAPSIALSDSDMTFLEECYQERPIELQDVNNDAVIESTTGP